MTTGSLGIVFQDGDMIVTQGDKGDCMFVIQEGEVEILREEKGKKVLLAVLGEGDFFGEMALFEDQYRLASVRARGEVRVLSIDKKNFLTRIHHDPSIAYRLVQTLINRLKDANSRLLNFVEESEEGKTIRLDSTRK